MLVVEQNTTTVNWSRGDVVHALEYAGDVVVVIDPSKTNMALIIGTPQRQILNVLEFSGNNRGRGPAMDTSLYCEELRCFLREYLRNCNLYTVGMEQAILKKGKFVQYHSTMVLTEIRGALLNFFLEEFNVKVNEINNWSWKSGVLPDGYRSNKEKGSKRFFQEHLADSPYAYYFEADVTDCICMYWYLCDNYCSKYSLYCNRVEKSLSGFTFSFVPFNSEVCAKLQEVIYNPRFTLEDNITYYTNRILNTFCLEIDTVDVPISAVYGHSLLFDKSNLHDKKVKVVAVRK
ncbi:MAG: hypothetical protein NC548_11385 [Lachnospiraceae bacterium]|nr:hypothetical protein [Lachnospiraceae bacterium]